MQTLFTGLTPTSTAFIHTPLIEIAPVDDDSALRQAANRLSDYNYLLFTSRYAVKYFFASLGKQATRQQQPAGLQFVSIGPTTSDALRGEGITNIAEAERSDSYGVISWFSRQPLGRVLIPRSSLALPLIPDGLRHLGFTVTTITAYVNRMPSHPQRVDLAMIDRIIFTSPSTIDNFIRLYGALPPGKTYETRGRITAAHLKNILTK